MACTNSGRKTQNIPLEAFSVSRAKTFFLLLKAKETTVEVWAIEPDIRKPTNDGP